MRRSLDSHGSNFASRNKAAPSDRAQGPQASDMTFFFAASAQPLVNNTNGNELHSSGSFPRSLTICDHLT